MQTQAGRENAFKRLAKSKFRSRFHLSADDWQYIAEKGMETIRRVWSSGFDEHHDSAYQDLTIDRSMLINQDIEMQPNVYYFSYYGNRMSGVDVQLTDAFFQDPASIQQTYILPLRMSNVKGADRINEEMDYTLYCVRYVNPWEGYYLVKGTADQLEKCTIVHTATTSLTTCEYVNKDGVKMTLSFGSEKDDNCTISGDDVTGSGNYGHGTEAKAWGNKDRDALYLKYTAGGKSYDETLVLQRRGEFAGTVKEFN